MSFRILFTLLILTALPAWASAPVPRIEASRSTCTAPCDIFFDARSTSDADLQEHWQELIDLTYSWDFGDPGSGNWATGASHHSKNIDTGFVSGHVYNEPGEYVVNLKVSDGTSVGSAAPVTITVISAETTWPGTKTVCVRASSSGSWNGCPGGAAQVTTSDFDQALSSSSYCDTDGQSRRCLFRAGDSFSVSTDTRFASNGPVMIGRFGSGADPRINIPSGTKTRLFLGGSSTHQKIIADLDIHGTDEPDQNFYKISGQSQYVLILRVDMRNLHSSINLYAGGSAYVQGSNMPNHFSIVDSSSLSNSSHETTVFFSSAEQLIFMGNDFGDMDGSQHVFRMGWTVGAAISHNNLGRRCGSTQHVMKIHNHKWDEGPGCTRDFIVADNLIEACQNNKLSVEAGSNSEDGEPDCVENFVFERNHFKNDRCSYGGHKNLKVEGPHAAIRHNLFDLSGQATFTARGLDITSKKGIYPDGSRVHNNTCYVDSATQGGVLCIDVGGGIKDLVVKNNLMFDKGGHARGLIEAESSSAVAYCDSGSGQGDCNVYTRTSPFVSGSPNAFSDFRLNTGGNLIDAGDYTNGMGIDTPNSIRPLDGNGDQVIAFNIGAFQQNGSAIPIEETPAAPETEQTPDPPITETPPAPPAAPTLLKVQ